MNFNQAVPLQLRPKYSEGSELAPARDSRNNSQAWKKSQTVSRQENSNTIAIQKLSSEVSKQRRRIVGGFIPQKPNPPPLFPFAVYKCSPPAVPLNPDGTPILPLPQATTFDSTGRQVVCNLDTTNPTNFAAVPPTVNPLTDVWRFYAVRNGYVQTRPYFSVISMGQLNNSFSYNKDYTYLYQVYDGTDGINPFGFSSAFYEWNDPITTPETPLGFLVIPSIGAGGNGQPAPDFGAGGLDLDFDGNILFSLWLEITPDPADGSSFIQIKVNGWRWSLDIGGFYLNNPFPSDSPNIIPIAVIKSGNASFSTVSPDPYDLVVDQIQSGHVINRYLPGMYNPGASFGNGGGVPTPTSIVPGPLIFRGDWDMDDIQSQVFYPGDFVKQTPTNAQNPQLNGLTCLFSCNAVTFSNDPSNDPNFQTLYSPPPSYGGTTPP